MQFHCRTFGQSCFCPCQKMGQQRSSHFSIGVTMSLLLGASPLQAAAPKEPAEQPCGNLRRIYLGCLSATFSTASSSCAQAAKVSAQRCACIALLQLCVHHAGLREPRLKAFLRASCFAQMEPAGFYLLMRKELSTCASSYRQLRYDTSCIRSCCLGGVTFAKCKGAHVSLRAPPGPLSQGAANGLRQKF